MLAIATSILSGLAIGWVISWAINKTVTRVYDTQSAYAKMLADIAELNAALDRVEARLRRAESK